MAFLFIGVSVQLDNYIIVYDDLALFFQSPTLCKLGFSYKLNSNSNT